MSEYDLHSMLLAHLINIVGVIAEGKKVKKFDPIPAPRTAADRRLSTQSLEAAKSLISMLTPHARIDP